MSKSNYSGNFTKEELKALEEDRKAEIEELAERKAKDKARRKARGDRHCNWGESVDD